MHSKVYHFGDFKNTKSVLYHCCITKTSKWYIFQWQWRYTFGRLFTTQDELGERMGVKKSFVSKIESGKGIAYSTIMRAFKALGAETATLDLGKLGRVALW